MFENPNIDLNARCNFCVKNLCFFICVDLHISLSEQQHPKYKQTRNDFSFVNTAVHTIPQTKV